MELRRDLLPDFTVGMAPSRINEVLKGGHLVCGRLSINPALRIFDSGKRIEGLLNCLTLWNRDFWSDDVSFFSGECIPRRFEVFDRVSKLPRRQQEHDRQLGLCLRLPIRTVETVTAI